MSTDTPLEISSRPRRVRRFLRDAAIAIVSLGVGLGAVEVVQREGGNDPAFLTDDHVSVTKLPIPAVAPGVPGNPKPVEPSAEFEAIDDPTRALTMFIEAEKNGDLDRSYALLVTEDQELFPSPASWEDAHQEMPEVTGLRIVNRSETSGGFITFHVELSLQPRLDEIIGAVASSATGNFVARQVGPGDWRIAFSESSLTPSYPHDSGAREAAVTWAKARQRCERAAEWDGGLLGDAAEEHAKGLCHTTSTVLASEPVLLDRASGTEPVLAAFGPAASIWARVVRVSGPIDLDVVTAPLGEGWVVVGVLQTSSGGSS